MEAKAALEWETIGGVGQKEREKGVEWRGVQVEQRRHGHDELVVVGRRDTTRYGQANGEHFYLSIDDLLRAYDNDSEGVSEWSTTYPAS